MVGWVLVEDKTAKLHKAVGLHKVQQKGSVMFVLPFLFSFSRFSLSLLLSRTSSAFSFPLSLFPFAVSFLSLSLSPGGVELTVFSHDSHRFFFYLPSVPASGGSRWCPSSSFLLLTFKNRSAYICAPSSTDQIDFAVGFRDERLPSANSLDLLVEIVIDGQVVKHEERLFRAIKSQEELERDNSLGKSLRTWTWWGGRESPVSRIY